MQCMSSYLNFFLLFSYAFLILLFFLLFNARQNGKLLRSLKSHTVAVVSLNWEEDGQMTRVCCHLSNCRPYINLILMDEIMNSLWFCLLEPLFRLNFSSERYHSLPKKLSPCLTALLVSCLLSFGLFWTSTFSLENFKFRESWFTNRNSNISRQH